MRHATGAQKDGLRRLLNEWDLIGVGDLSAEDDEYDCLLEPLLTRLAAGARPDEITGYLRQRLPEHFGAESDDLDDFGIDEFARKAVAWWDGA